MSFKLKKSMLVKTDNDNKTRLIGHVQDPYQSNGLENQTKSALAEDYIKDVSDIYELDKIALDDLHSSPISIPDIELKEQLRMTLQKQIMGTSVIEFTQTYFGLPIWEAGLAVSIHEAPQRISSSVNTLHYDIKVENPKIKYPERELEKINAEFLNKTFSLDKLKSDSKRSDISKKLKIKEPKINRKRYLIYQYDPDMRIDPEIAEHQNEKSHESLHKTPPTFALKEVPKNIVSGNHYVVIEVMFTQSLSGWPNLNWRAFIDPRTGAVLYLRALVSGVDGLIFESDPISQTGDATLTAGSPDADLNPLRTSVTLQGLTAPDPGDDQELTGEYVELQELVNPAIASPEEAVGDDFDYNATSDNFSAVNAYHHCDGVFRMIADMGFNMATYFNGATFPVPVDHRGENGGNNAHANGNAMGNGIGNLTFGLADSSEPAGIATDRRVVLHEFGHVLLWDHVNSANFGFAHSAGDSLAAILSDPESDAPDRFQTFPWVPIVQYRRHDKDVASGWAWEGANDTGSYNSEQILSTTLFRAYRALGGDSSGYTNSLAIKSFAAEYMAYLIINSIGTLTPATNPNNAEAYATALINADMGTDDYNGHPGGAFHKVIRWAFEKQGSYQPVGAPSPVVSEGAPPAVDVYINDGRDGEYEYQRNFWNTTDIWNREAADGSTVHQTPILDQPNYVYVKVKNRGSELAENVVVKGHHRHPGAGLVWPDDWQSMTTASINAPDIPAGGEITVGPFEWTPAVEGHECLLMIVEADGDPSNVNNINGAQTIQHSRLVPFDNNIAQRNVAPVPGGGGLNSLADALKNRVFQVKNPYKISSKMSLVPILPKVLLDKGWKLKFNNLASDQFMLAPYEERKVTFDLIPGNDFNAAELNGVQDITIELFANKLLVGGMTYAIDPKMKRPAIEKGSSSDCKKKKAAELLKCLDLDIDKVKNVCIKKVSIDIETENDCC